MLAREALLEDGSSFATPDELEAIRRHAQAVYPHESYGLLLPSGYLELENISPEPERSAYSDGEALARALEEGVLRAVVHSHPDGPDCPSEQDMRAQVELEVPSVIISTNGSASLDPFVWGDMLVDPRPLIGRPFRHGVDDCYAALRAWYWAERRVRLGDYPRQWEWWLENGDGEKDLYQRYFANEGFYQIEPADMMKGDVWLAAVRSAVPNHAGVYLGEGLMFHHASSRLAFDPMRLSRREPIARWAPFITHYLRRD